MLPKDYKRAEERKKAEQGKNAIKESSWNPFILITLRICVQVRAFLTETIQTDFFLYTITP